MKVQNFSGSDKNVSIEKLLEKNVSSVKLYYLLGIVLGMTPTSGHVTTTMKPKRTKSNLYLHLMIIFHITSLCYIVAQVIKQRDENLKLLNTKNISYVCIILILNVFVAITTNIKFPVQYFSILAEIDSDFVKHNTALTLNFYRKTYMVQLNYLVYLTISNSVKLGLLLISLLECDVILGIVLCVETLCKCYILHTLILTLFYVDLRFKKINETITYIKKGRILENRPGYGFLLPVMLNFLSITYHKIFHERFEKVNEIVKVLLRTTNYKNVCLNDVTLIKDVTDKLYHLCRMHYKLCHLMRELNKTFAFQLLCSLAVSMGDVLFQSYYLYHLLFNDVPDVTTTMILCPIVWLVDEMVEIFLLVRSCASTCESANVTPILLHEFRNELDNIEIESHIQMYSLQMLHQKIRVSALGFFDIDYSLIYSIVGAVTTYLVIFIQFDQQNTDIRLYPSLGNCSAP